MTIDDKIQSLLKHITRLSELIQMENNLLAQPGRQVRLTEIIEEKQALKVFQGDIKKSLMIGDSETDANAAKNAGIPVILLEDGYTEKNTTEIYHNHLIKDFIGIEKIVSKYL